MRRRRASQRKGIKMANAEKIAAVVRQVLQEEGLTGNRNVSSQAQRQPDLSPEAQAYNRVLDDVVNLGDGYSDAQTITVGEVRQRINRLRKR